MGWQFFDLWAKLYFSLKGPDFLYSEKKKLKRHYLHQKKKIFEPFFCFENLEKFQGKIRFGQCTVYFQVINFFSEAGNASEETAKMF